MELGGRASADRRSNAGLPWGMTYEIRICHAKTRTRRTGPKRPIHAVWSLAAATPRCVAPQIPAVLDGPSTPGIWNHLSDLRARTPGAEFREELV